MRLTRVRTVTNTIQEIIMVSSVKKKYIKKIGYAEGLIKLNYLFC